nr:hypothetical protein [Candidatus Sigynarchaeota archaeon]
MDWKRISTIGLIAGGIQFLILSSIAMLAYPGGTKYDPTTVGYLFWNNMFSDLGRTVAHNGMINSIASPLYISAMWILGVLFIPFYIAFPSRARLEGRGKPFSTWVLLARILGIGATIFFILSASFTQDLFPVLHLRFAQFIFVLMTPVALIYWRVLASDQGKADLYSNCFLFFAIVIVSGIIITIASGDPVNEMVVTIQATTQKVMVYTWNLVMFIEAFGLLHEQRDGGIHGLEVPIPVKTGL